MSTSRKSKRVSIALRLFLAFAVAAGAVCLLKGRAISDMNLMDEDSLSDIQGQTGLSLVLRMRTTGGDLRVSATGNLSMSGVTINNSGTGFGRIGNYDDPALLDIGNNGSSVRMRLLFPNGMDGATELAEVPSIQAASVTWTDSLGTDVNVGTLAINQIYQNRITLTAWFHSSGLNLLAQLNGDITDVHTYKGTGRGLYVQNTYFSFDDGSGSDTNPGRGNGYFSFGGSSSMSFDIYTYDRVYGAAEAPVDGNPPVPGYADTPGSPDGRRRSIIRITYPVTGTFRIRNGRIGPHTDGSGWHDYGPIIMENMRNGEVTIELPCSVGSANYVYFNPDT